jgi:hypothetical protein
MSTPFIKLVGVATSVASVIASDWSLYSLCKAPKINYINKWLCASFDVEAGDIPFFYKDFSNANENLKRLIRQ